MLEIKELQQFYGASHTLWDIDLKVAKNTCLCLMGRNGVGKTTLLKAVMGLIPVAEGSIMFDGIDLSKSRTELRAELGIGFVPQGREIFPLLTVEENLKVGLRAARKQGIKQIPESVYALFPVLKQMLNRRGGDLSGGQQQQLAIARALVLNPRFLILDEPTEGIQPNIISDIGDVITRLNRELGMTVLLVEQKLPFARKVADSFSILDRGRHVAGGQMHELDDAMVKEYLTV
jgi:urea transport system ATP-binding protein